MAIDVYHNPDFLAFNRGPGRDPLDLRRLYLAAIVATDDPERAYRSTQHLGQDWYDRPDVTTVVRSRSTSVGDVLVTEDGRLLRVAPFGFDPLPGATLPAGASGLTHALRAVAVALEETGEGEHAAALRQATAMTQHTFTALLFALPLLEAVAADAEPADPHHALLARFAAEQGRWALQAATAYEPA